MGSASFFLSAFAFLAGTTVAGELLAEGWNARLLPPPSSAAAAYLWTPEEIAFFTGLNRDDYGTVWPISWAKVDTAGLAGFPWASRNLHGPIRLSASYGLFPADKLYPFGQPFETFQGGWGSSRLNPEQGVAAGQLPPALSLEVAYPFTRHLYGYARASLKRDIRSWHSDALGGNWPLGMDEVDLNEPSLGYLTADSRWGSLIFGRFPMHIGPSPEYSLLVGGQKPYHDGALFTLKAPVVRYHFFFSSLNPWLQGSVPGELSSEDYPVGSEEWRQRHYPQAWAENAHGRVYAERAKSLAVHRLETHLALPQDFSLTLGLSEMQIIGGKVPSLYDLQPFTVWHNDFKIGYTNNLVHLDARLRMPLGMAFFGEIAMDDLPYARKEGDKQHAILGWLLGAEQKGGWQGIQWVQRLHVIRTDPLLYHFIQPLNTLYARHILSTNDQRSSDPTFVDRLVIDYPVGYVRGGDAFDYWYSASGFFPRQTWLPRGAFALFKAAYLQHGEVSIDTPKETIDDALSSPTGIPLEEWRGEITASVPLPQGLTARVGAGGSRWEKGDDGGHHFWAEAGLLWSWGGE